MTASRPVGSVPLREPVEFPPNSPVLVALQYAGGKTIPTAKGERVMYTLADGRVMFLDPGQARQIAALGPKVREEFFISKQWSGKRGDPVEWTMWLAPEAERARAAGEGVKIRTAPRAGNVAGPAVVVPALKPHGLEAALKSVVAAVHATNEYAKSIGYSMPQFTGEDLRTMAFSVMQGMK
jgi:hypothetical protein